MFIIVKRAKLALADSPRPLQASESPQIQPTQKAAQTEAERLARIYTESEFLVFKLVAGFESVDKPIKHTTYV